VLGILVPVQEDEIAEKFCMLVLHRKATTFWRNEPKVIQNAHVICVKRVGQGRPARSVERVDLYAGVMISNIYGGLANGYQATQNIAPTAGLRVKF
jgi:hypothetical protein